MDKKFLIRLIVPLAALADAIFWLLSILPDTKATFEWFTLAWGATIILGALGVSFLLGVFGTNDVVVKKFRIYAAAIIFILTFLCLTCAIVIPDKIIVPIIAIIITAAVVLTVLFTGGRKWDAGDNRRAGYKTYRQRKAEEEKNK